MGKRIRDMFVKHDERRERWRVQPMGWVAAALVVNLVAALAAGVWGRLAGPRLRVTPTAQPTPVAAESTGPPPRPAATPIVHGCPDDPALWTLVPYRQPGAEETVLYAVDPPCVMERVEQAFAAYVDARAERGRNWTADDDARYFSSGTFTAIVSGDEIGPPPPGTWETVCAEAVKGDGAPVGSADYHVVFHTMADDKRVANLMVAVGGFPSVTRTYDCATGELVEEEPVDGTQTLVMVQPMVYDADGVWRLGWRYDVSQFVPSDQIDPAATARMILDAQGRR
jgi:hypothetical protein